MSFRHQITITTHGFGSPTYEIHGNATAFICEDAQREGNYTLRQRLQPLRSTALSSLNSSGLNVTSIRATGMLKSASRMVKKTQVWDLTYLQYRINRLLK